MSGSSLDGLDVVYCQFSFDKKWSFKIIHTKDYSIKCWETRLKNARDLSPKKLDILDFAFGGFIGEKVSEFIEEFQIKEIDIVASHGHTIYHFPEKGITKQIGLGKQIFDKIKVPVLTNLRQKDIDLGGSGAPIVPIGDLHIFNEYKYCLNIGGIANVSIKNDTQNLNKKSVIAMTKELDCKQSNREASSSTQTDCFISRKAKFTMTGKNNISAFDICSANQVLNYFAFLKGKAYDDKGHLARKGNLNIPLLEQLNTLEYYKKSAPKSLDNLFTNKVLKQFKNFDISVEDKLHTYCEHIAFQVSESLQKNRHCDDQGTCLINFSQAGKQQLNNENANDKILITGGGTFNDFLIERITFYLVQKNIEVVIPNSEIINYKEALVMAFMGVLYLRNEVNCLSSVTGAKRDSVCGELLN